MKSLDQIELRTVVNAADTPSDGNDLFVISQPGSYYLVTNIAGAQGENGISGSTGVAHSIQAGNSVGLIVVPSASGTISGSGEAASARRTPTPTSPN
ncbi:MAG: hypothetical protein ABSF38_18850 [Verrucomicrobiota bacterium]|jgi:hypothetical protein